LKKVIYLMLLVSMPSFAGNVLTWQDNSTNETAFHIERKAGACTSLSSFAEIATVGANVTTYTDNAVSEGSTYCYRVAAGNSAGKSGYSNTADRLVPVTVPNAPSNLGVSGN